jgi:hypothetical protein
MICSNVLGAIIVFKNSSIFYPKNIYLDLDFDKIKNSFDELNTSYQDFGSIIIIQDSYAIFSINDLGKVQAFYDDIDQTELKRNISNIENIFKKQINDFEIILN